MDVPDAKQYGDSGFNNVLAKLLAGEMRKRVFNQLGAIVNDLPSDRLTRDERKQVKLQVLGFIEEACKEFFPLMRERIERDEPKGISNGKRVAVSHDRSRDPNFPD